MLVYDTVKLLNVNNLNLAREIRRTNNIRRGHSSVEAYAFIITTLRLLFPNITDEWLTESITDDLNDGGFDAIFISRAEQTISIFDCKISSGFSYANIESLKNNIEKYIFNDQQSLIGLSPNAKRQLEVVREKIACEWELKIYVVRQTKRNATYTPTHCQDHFFLCLRCKLQRFL